MFFFFCEIKVQFLHLDPDPVTQINADPCFLDPVSMTIRKRVPWPEAITKFYIC